MDHPNPFVGFLFRRGFQLNGNVFVGLCIHKYKVYEDPLHYWINCIQSTPDTGKVIGDAFHVKGWPFEDEKVEAELRKRGMKFRFEHL